MQTLTSSKLEPFCKRFENFQDAEIRSLEVLSPTNIQLTLAVQDSARGFDWITLTFCFLDVSGATLPQTNNLSLLDTSDGITILDDKGVFYFGVGNYKNSSSIKNAPLFIQAKTIKTQEGEF